MINNSAPKKQYINITKKITFNYDFRPTEFSLSFQLQICYEKKTHKKEFKQKRWNSKNYEFIQLTDWHFVDVNFSPTPDTKAIIIFEFL